MSASLIGLDWGSTHLRAYLFGADGKVLQTRALAHGIRQLPAGGFPEAFVLAVREWPVLPVLACGMVGSRNGWQEVPYLDTPTGVERLAQHLTPLATPGGHRLYLVPGLHDPQRPDVMRGEETQIVGVLATAPATTRLLLPGTHSKWVRLRDGVVTDFATVMTGELYGLLRQHSILGAALPEARDDEEAFRRGVAAARDSGPAGALSRLFSARALMLDGVLDPAAVPDYLSGLLIGEEMRMALAAGWADANGSIPMVGEGPLCDRYRRAADLYGLHLSRAPDGTTADGLWQIATAAALAAAPATAHTS
ncbi:2-dehydro-3-deoxygalactonokinase [Dyella sp. LX-66]|uniref:2-dehydro-3-deoxygalactonokinase n=1 Tax=unclassified Dyella TaxID=2634549 RepID=UPI001BDFD8CA|nr:2-dehydro-3-deoxygalactonokinase [Dyella sp. LX-1]MBT2141953.1 2-dehydro-3-deoxygalactonokinase [Dyella sp. LX-66]